MKWFKHDSGAHNDEKIRDLIHEFGCEGYGVYMIILELIAEKIDANLSPCISISDRVLREKCRVSRKKATKFLSFFGENNLIFSKLSDRTWDISCPNLLNRLDNWTKNSQVPNKKLSTNQNQKKNKNQKKKENKKTPQAGLFSETQEKKIKAKIAEKQHHNIDSEANKIAFDNLIKGILKDKDIKNPVAVALHRAAL
jgi:hypothetical protein